MWTIGYGSTGSHVRPGLKITQPEAEELLRLDLDRFEKAVDRLVKVPLTDNQFATLVAFSFNIGVAAFGKSTLLRKLNAGDYEAVPTQLARWNKDNGKVVQGLANRRAAEAGLWARGAFVSSSYVKADAGRANFLTTDTLYPAAGLVTSVVTAVNGNDVLTWAIAGAIFAATVLGLAWGVRKILKDAT